MRSERSDSQQRIQHIDGLRGVAIALVVLFHLWIFTGRAGDTSWNPLSYGYTGVHLFLVISGFCVCWPYANDQPFALHEFTLRRAYRLMPPYLVALSCFAVIAVAFSRLHWDWPEDPNADVFHTIKYTISHAVLIHNILPNHILALNGPFWSIALEAQLYLTVPLVVMLMHRYGTRWTLLVAALVTLFFRGGILTWYGSVSNLDKFGTLRFVIMHSLPARWLEFVLGAGAAYIVAQRKPLPSAGFLIICGLLSLVGGAYTVKAFGENYPLADPLFGVGYYLLLLSGVASSTFVLSRWCVNGMKLRPLVLLGQVSFSVYLVHQPFIRLFCGWLHGLTLIPTVWFACSFCLALPAALLLSITFYWLVERPSIELARKRLARHKLLRPLPSVPNTVMEVAETKIA